MSFGKYSLLSPLLLIACLAVFIANPKAVLSQNLTTNNTANYKVRTWFGYSYRSVVLLGKTANTTTQFYSLGISKHVKTYSSGSHLYYTVDVTPYLKYNYPQRDNNQLKTDAIGFGFSPFGVQFEHLFSNRLSLLSGTSGGFALVNQNFPTDKGRKLNFMFDLSTSILTKLANHCCRLQISSHFKCQHRLSKPWDRF